LSTSTLPEAVAEIVIHRETFRATPHGATTVGTYVTGSRWDIRRWKDAGRRGRTTVPDMRTERGQQRFYATGWLVSCVITAVAFVQWRAYVREVELGLVSPRVG
jgi:hypothetical protein